MGVRGYQAEDSLLGKRHTKPGSGGGGLVHVHPASRHRAPHSKFRRAARPFDSGVSRLGGGLLWIYRVREKKVTARQGGGGGILLSAEVQWAPWLLETAPMTRTCPSRPLGPKNPHSDNLISFMAVRTGHGFLWGGMELQPFRLVWA